MNEEEIVFKYSAEFELNKASVQQCIYDAVQKARADTLEKVIKILTKWADESCDDGCKTSDGMKVYGFDKTDWYILLDDLKALAQPDTEDKTW